MTNVKPVVIDLRSFDLVSGSGTRREIEVPAAGLIIAAQRYVVDPARPAVVVDLSRSASGWFFRLRLSAEAVGPCSRCLEEARIPVEVDAREFAAAGREPDAEFDEDFDCEYLTADRLDVTSWVRDCVAESLPTVVVCRPDCRGICPTCGANLNEGDCECPKEPEIDPRWAGLTALAEQLGDPD
jgi:uncharacterized protein